MLITMMYVVLCWSCQKAVMRLPGLEAPEGGNIFGIYGVLRVFVVDTATVVWAAFMVFCCHYCLLLWISNLDQHAYCSDVFLCNAVAGVLAQLLVMIELILSGRSIGLSLVVVLSFSNPKVL